MEYFKNENDIYFAKMKNNAIIPGKEIENAGYDFYACFEDDYIFIEPNKTKLVSTGIAWASSPKYYLQIEERSSTGSKGIKKSAGVIDSGYRGEIKIAITNSNSNPLIFINLDEEEFKEKYPELVKDNPLLYSTKKAIAQGIIHKVEEVNIKEISLENLLNIPSKRGDKGWGSSNKN